MLCVHPGETRQLRLEISHGSNGGLQASVRETKGGNLRDVLAAGANAISWRSKPISPLMSPGAGAVVIEHFLYGD